ncbi:MAG TPA: 2Fe-2S iron-sulfur cluster-binding protein, partial [Caldilineaceae bacterium]|nr:2Fe-2S iron-sulfur cluster-binding protein [Caldilineaceae bacterium]
GFRQVDLRADEILTRLSFRPLTAQHDGVFIKLGLRRAQAISVLNVAVVVHYRGGAERLVKEARISLGAVAPTVIRAKPAEAVLQGKPLNEAAILESARLAAQSTTPIDDIRGSADYRRAMAETLVARALQQIASGQSRAGWPVRPVLLWGVTDGKWPVATPSPFTIHNSPFTIVNGQPLTLAGGKTLLDSLRGAGLVGVKEGCAEGECGACTVFLDGMAIMACVTPAERAVGSEVVTVEGLRQGEPLHRVQEALVQSGGVQCGYCTPGFVMSAAKLLEERPHPTRAEAEEALTGNLCRCTGYRKILDAVVAAGGSAGG